jgi:pyrroline-5-carboxylate reductase
MGGWQESAVPMKISVSILARMNLAIVGCGAMGTTYAQSLIHAQLVDLENLQILEIDPEKRQHLIGSGFKQAYAEPGEWLSRCEIVIIAVKPQDFLAAANSIAAFLHSSQMVLSVMAGVKMAVIQDKLGTPKVVRAMPNLPSRIGLGMTAYTASEQVSREELVWVQNLIGATGKALYFREEDQVDAATAISGSGPGYVFYFMQSMVDAATSIGFNHHEARVLVQQTFLGAAQMVMHEEATLDMLVSRVASKGGTTQAALEVFKRYGLSQTLREGVKAAYVRAQELSQTIR